jgi:hypothetical protein
VLLTRARAAAAALAAADDGNFFAPYASAARAANAPHNAVLNALHAKCVPAVGGATRFLDSTGALRAGAAHQPVESAVHLA